MSNENESEKANIDKTIRDATLASKVLLSAVKAMTTLSIGNIGLYMALTDLRLETRRQILRDNEGFIYPSNLDSLERDLTELFYKRLIERRNEIR